MQKCMNSVYKRLIHQCQYRGTRECDLLLKRFVNIAQPWLQQWTDQEWNNFDLFLNEDEHLIFDWLILQKDIPNVYQWIVRSIICPPLSATYTHLSKEDLLNKASFLAHALKQHPVTTGAFCFYGDLGVGKTTFIRHMIQTLLNDDQHPVPSPTFTLLQDYQIITDRSNFVTLWHSDLYRLSDELECVELGILEYIKKDLCLIEWPDRLGRFMPLDRVDIHITLDHDVDLENNFLRSIRIKDHRCTTIL